MKMRKGMKTKDSKKRPKCNRERKRWCKRKHNREKRKGSRETYTYKEMERRGVGWGAERDWNLKKGR